MLISSDPRGGSWQEFEEITSEWKRKGGLFSSRRASPSVGLSPAVGPHLSSYLRDARDLGANNTAASSRGPNVALEFRTFCPDV